MKTYIKNLTCNVFYPKKVSKETLNTSFGWLSSFIFLTCELEYSSLSYDKFLSATDVDAMCWIRYSPSLQVVDGIIHY